jgi:thioesterase domain-containing protein
VLNFGGHVALLRRGNNNSNNLFIIHDVSGDIGGYIDVCSLIDADYNIYGIRTSINELYPQNISIEILAKEYLELIRKLQSKGNLNIAGWSAGGIIALEIARQVEKSGGVVNKVIMFDSYINQSFYEEENMFTIESEKKYISKLLNYNDEVVNAIQKYNDLQLLWKVI